MKKIVLCDKSGVWVQEPCSECNGSGRKQFLFIKFECKNCIGRGHCNIKHEPLMIQGGVFGSEKINAIIADCEKYMIKNPKIPKGHVIFNNFYKLEFRRDRVREDVLAGLTYLLNMNEIKEKIMQEMGAKKVEIKK